MVVNLLQMLFLSFPHDNPNTHLKLHSISAGRIRRLPRDENLGETPDTLAVIKKEPRVEL